MGSWWALKNYWDGVITLVHKYAETDPNYLPVFAKNVAGTQYEKTLRTLAGKKGIDSVNLYHRVKVASDTSIQDLKEHGINMEVMQASQNAEQMEFAAQQKVLKFDTQYKNFEKERSMAQFEITPSIGAEHSDLFNVALNAMNYEQSAQSGNLFDMAVDKELLEESIKRSTPSEDVAFLTKHLGAGLIDYRHMGLEV